MSRTLSEKIEIVHRWFQDNVFDRDACQPQYQPLSLSPHRHDIQDNIHHKRVRVFTFNTWGLPIAPSCSSRLSFLSSEVLQHYDIVCLQEMSHNRDVYALIKEAHKHGLKHCHQFRQGVGFPVWNGVTAPGLLVCSRYPIVDIMIKRFPVNGRLERIDHSDWVAGKGVGMVRIQIQGEEEGEAEGDTLGIDIFLTHIHANYSNYYFDYQQVYQALDTALFSSSSSSSLSSSLSSSSLSSSLSVVPTPLTCPDMYLSHRVCQAVELAKFVCYHRHPSHLTIVCGDLNAPPYDIVIHLIQRMAGLHDAYTLINPLSSGYTCGAHDNTYSKYSEAIARGEHTQQVLNRHGSQRRGRNKRQQQQQYPHKHTLHETPKRIDYILFSYPNTHNTTLTHRWALLDCQLVKPITTIHGRAISLSDHHGVSATFTWETITHTNRETNGHTHRHTTKSKIDTGTADTQASVTLTLNPSPPPSPQQGRRQLTQEDTMIVRQPVVTAPSYSPSPLSSGSDGAGPSLSCLLLVADWVIAAGIEEVAARRRRHWLSSMFSLMLFVFLFVTHVQTDLSAYWVTYWVDTLVQYLPVTCSTCFLSSFSVRVMLYLLSVLSVVSPFYSLFEFLLAQIPAKEEQIALMETKQQVALQLAIHLRQERAQRRVVAA